MLKYTGFDIVFQEIPDEVTLAVNISNCPHRCPGCHSPYLWEDTGEPLTTAVLADWLTRYGKEITCICFMGGDASPDEVAGLARYLGTQLVAPVKTGWYSGRSSLPEGFSTEWFHYIKLGPYLQEKGPLSSPGTNQRLYRRLTVPAKFLPDPACRAAAAQDPIGLSPEIWEDITGQMHRQAPYILSC
ncbi:MAG TPA: anaerobic ribonucleoside-triphosphate reductase activating protein [Bacteroidales bacterium]|nr:anaerobic ribonucleoside-triphosphate reductase activating protein [Bacteroidales bacterium]HPS24563.1 anaerobic ribonucleoside-triphosphate reductase activating protein [Bacteroidales bacterium]